MTTMPQAAWDLAARAADRTTGTRAHPSVARGVLAQWIAEHGYQWPFSRNNPGNLARGWAAAFPYPFTVHFPNPQPGNPIVTFGGLAAGADCYAAGLVAFPRYAGAVSKARAGDGLGFAVAVCRAGFGTRESAVRTVYAALRPPAAEHPPTQPGGHDPMIRYAGVSSTRTRLGLRAGQPLYATPGGAKVTALVHAGPVPYVGLAGRADGQAWRAVLIGTGRPYADGVSRPTILYVPADAGEVVQS